jgi:hypothetical protein
LTELKYGTGDIYAYLSQQISIIRGFSERQLNEEFIKAKIYQNSSEAKKVLQILENHSFCRGRLEFVFYCLDITDRMSDVELFKKLKKLKKLKTVIFTHLTNYELSNEFKRAMFTITDFIAHGVTILRKISIV